MITSSMVMVLVSIMSHWKVKLLDCDQNERLVSIFVCKTEVTASVLLESYPSLTSESGSGDFRPPGVMFQQ